MKKILIIAGDKSADLYAGKLAFYLKKFNLEIYSLGGENLKNNSFQFLNLVNFSVSGIFEVFFKIFHFIKIFKQTLNFVEKIKPNLIILCDFPDFNLRLAKKINNRYPIFYYISPQIWAWRKKRVFLIKKFIKKMIVIFPFEIDLYKKYNIEVHYFGHPLLEIIPTSINPEIKKIITFMPGSRKNEIKKHLPILIKVKKKLEKRLNDYSFRIIKPQDIPFNFYKKYLQKENIEIINHSYEKIKESSFVIASSGTANLELAILEVPFLAIYKLNPFSFLFLKKMVKVNFISIVNILAKKKIVEELIQNKVNVQNITQIVLSYLENKKLYEDLKNNLKEIKNLLLPEKGIEKFVSFLKKQLNI